MQTDMTLLNAARRMNGDALVEIFNRYAMALYRYAFRLCHDAVMADHIVGDVFAKLLENLSSGTGPSTNLRSYLYEMAYHRMIDVTRSSRHTVSMGVIGFRHRALYSNYVSVENQLLFEPVRLAIQNNLTDDQRHVIILRFLEEFSVKETAAILGIEVGNVKVIQLRALAVLRRVLGNQVAETSAVPSRVAEITQVLTGDS